MIKPLCQRLILVLAFLSFAGTLLAQTERWQLGFEADVPRFVTIRDAGGSASTHWYMTYRITNKTGEERPLVLAIKALTDLKDPNDHTKNRAYSALVDPRVQEKVQTRLGKEVELLDIVQVQGSIADGETKHGIAIFGQLDPNVDELTVEIRGLVQPVSKEGAKSFLEQKVLQLRFERKGDEYLVTLDPVTRRAAEWKVLSRTEIPLPKKYDS